MIKPNNLKKGDLVAIFTPSFPAHIRFRDKYLHGVSELKRIGFRVLEGEVTASHQHQGYRTAPGFQRAKELMELFENKEVKAIISTIGGQNSASLLDHLNYDVIRANPKVFCGYSDVTSLHMAINKLAGLSTFYGPAVMPSFGEHPHLLPYSEESFLKATGFIESHANYEIVAPERWSGHIRDIPSGDWNTLKREYQIQPGWHSVNFDQPIEGELLIANLNTLLSLVGTRYFPNFDDKVVLLEDMLADFSEQERRWTQIRQMGVLRNAKALIVSKPEVVKSLSAPFNYTELLEEIFADNPLPRAYNFDCGHTSPMITLSQGLKVRLETDSSHLMKFFVLERMTKKSN